MDDHDVDRRLRRLFQAMRAEEAGRAPAFSRLAGVHPPKLAVRWLPLAAAAAALIVVGLWLLAPGPAETEVRLEQWAALSNWQASTDGLLTLSSGPWGSQVATSTDAWLERAAGETSTEWRERGVDHERSDAGVGAGARVDGDGGAG
jgi:hypothetical protein